LLLSTRPGADKPVTLPLTPKLTASLPPPQAVSAKAAAQASVVLEGEKCSVLIEKTLIEKHVDVYMEIAFLNR
jgi:hypothetical protein